MNRRIWIKKIFGSFAGLLGLGAIEKTTATQVATTVWRDSKVGDFAVPIASKASFEVGDLVYLEGYEKQDLYQIEMIESHRYASIRLNNYRTAENPIVLIEKCNWVTIKGKESVVTCAITRISHEPY